MAKKKKQTWDIKPEPNAFEARKARENALLEKVGYVKLTKEEHDRLRRLELEREADDILRKDYLEPMAANIQMICDNFASLQLPSNDPEYLKRLQTTEAQRNAIANSVVGVHIVPDGNKTWLGLGLNNPTNHAEARETALRIGEHFECKIITHEKEAS